MAGVFDGRMVFLIGMEDIRFGIEAESFMKEPFTIPDIGFFPGLIRLITTAGQSAVASSKEKPNCLALVERISKKITS